VLAAEFPVIEQLGAMTRGPLKGHAQGTAWESPGQHLSRLNGHLGLEFAILHMKMRWGVIVIEHADRRQGIPHPVHLRGVGLQRIITGKALIHAPDSMEFVLL
jgi:hypothetical protein